MAFCDKIIGFKDKIEKNFIAKYNSKDWNGHTTIAQGVVFAKKHRVSHFLIESYNYNIVQRLCNQDNPEMVNQKSIYFGKKMNSSL